MNPMEFDYIARVLKDRSGLDLSKDKTYLLESRLGPIARRRGFADLPSMIREMKMSGKEDLLKEVTDAMTTNESFFFRDKTPFDLFTNIILPSLMKSRASTKKIRIWCAAASTGQEPYSLAMILREKAAQLAGWRFEIIGTDICDDVLDRAREGVYSQFEVQRGLPIQMLVKNFDKKGERWQIKPELRSMVQYKNFNLLDSFAGMGQCDVVFCRNVLIYFDQPTKTDVLNRLSRVVPNDGFLLLGAAETIFGLTDAFRSSTANRSLYLPKGAVEPMAAAG